MRRVEFLGVMGAGKSSVFRACERYFSNMSAPMRLVPAERLKKEIILHELREQSVLKYFFLRSACLYPRLNTNLIRDNVPELAWVALEEQTAYWEPLLSYVLGGGGPCGGSSASLLRRMTWFMREVALVALLRRYAHKECVFHDEGLLQRGLGLALSKSEGINFIKEYARIVPVPDYVVFITGDAALIKSRLIQRNRNTNRHINDISFAIECSHVFAEILSGRGVKVLRLDGNVECNKNAESVIQEINYG